MTSIFKSKSHLLLIVFFIFLSGWWLSFQSVAVEGGRSVQWFGATYGVLALISALYGLRISKKWGGFKSVIGRAVLMFSFGLLAQEFGQLAYTYYLYGLKVEIPYPSLGDLGYFGSIPLYIYGAMLLAKASGVKISLRSATNKLQAILIPVILLLSSYAIFLKDYEFDGSSPVTTLLDFGYPLGQTVYLSIAFLTYLLSRKLLGGIMRNKILFVVFALLMQYVSDFTFLFQISRETWYAGGINDYMYLLSYFLMGLALLTFRNIHKSGTAKVAENG